MDNTGLRGLFPLKDGDPARRRKMLSLAAAGLAFALWFALNIDVPGWAGLLFFLIAWALGCCLAGVLLQRQTNQEMHRRTELVKLVRRRQTQTNSTT
jgi:hypothetical protein